MKKSTKVLFVIHQLVITILLILIIFNQMGYFQYNFPLKISKSFIEIKITTEYTYKENFPDSAIGKIERRLKGRNNNYKIYTIEQIKKFINSRNLNYIMVEQNILKISGFKTKDKLISFNNELIQYFGNKIETEIIEE